MQPFAEHAVPMRATYEPSMTPGSRTCLLLLLLLCLLRLHVRSLIGLNKTSWKIIRCTRPLPSAMGCSLRPGRKSINRSKARVQRDLRDGRSHDGVHTRVVQHPASSSIGSSGHASGSYYRLQAAYRLQQLGMSSVRTRSTPGTALEASPELKTTPVALA